MSYHELLISKGWVQGKKCASCGGRSKYPYTNDDTEFNGWVIEVMPTQQLWRLKILGRKRGGGSLEHLQHQHFLQ